MLKKIWVPSFLASIVLFLASCGGTLPVQPTSGYSRYNLHYVAEKGMVRGSYLNWTNWPGHGVVPYNTKVQIVPSPKVRSFDITTDTGMTINWGYDPKMTGVSTDDYIKLIISPTPVKYEGLSDIDMQGIQQGKALPGMCKQGVMVALGYPARHRTPSLESNEWVYWTSAHDPISIYFDQNGKVK